MEFEAEVEELQIVIESVMPSEVNLDKRQLPGIDILVDSQFLSRYETGVDCDAILGGRILIGNL